MIDVRDVSGGYSNKEILNTISFNVKEGEFFGIIGPNGSGKTTLLNMINGILPVTSGQVFMNGQAVETYSPKEFAQLVAVLPQHMAQTFRYTVKETVALGRYAHQKGLFQTFSEADERIVQDVMQKTGVMSYQTTLIDQLSGGERQRVFLAQALAQQPKILLLDEPTNHLDLAYQKELLDLLKQWTEKQELTVLSIFHDLNLASIYCDQLLLLHQGRTMICDDPDEVLRPQRIQQVYGTEVEKRPHPKVSKPQIMLVPEKSPGKEGATIIDESILRITDQLIQLEAPFPLKTMSSGVIGSGMGWHRTFVNRHVSKNYAMTDSKQDMRNFLMSYGFSVNETVAMMTPAHVTDAAYQFLQSSTCSVLIVVTAEDRNAVDAVHGFQSEILSGTINTWVFVNGKLSNMAFIQCLMTATEAKVKVLHDEDVMNEVSDTTASGISADNTLLAGTQHGQDLLHGEADTSLGSMIRTGVYHCTKKALERSRR